MLVGSSTSDDAGVVLLSPDVALILTTDFFTPMVDDPYDFGRIAAANALSDVYAMGGRPLSALNITGFPATGVDGSVLREILRGGHAVAREAGIEIVGGHTVKNAEPLYGLSVVGTVHPEKIVTNAAAKPGDRLFLTKPVGNALVTTAFKNGNDRHGALGEAVRWMIMLNRTACDAMVSAGARAATDVTGFGLIGHLANLLEASGVSAVIKAKKVPLLPGAYDYAEDGYVCGGSKANKDQLEERVRWGPEVDEALRCCLSDAQTSGGLLIAIAEEKQEALLAEFEARGVEVYAKIGGVVERREPLISVE